MKTISVKTSELAGEALRYAVADACFFVKWLDGWNCYEVTAPGFIWYIGKGVDGYLLFEPDRDWSLLGPLLQSWAVDVEHMDGKVECRAMNVPVTQSNDAMSHEADVCIAACRAIAAAHWGEYADIPEDLVDAALQQESNDG